MRARRVFPCAPRAKFRFSMAHLGPKHLSPLRKSFIPSRRHSRHTGPRYLANVLLLNPTPLGWPAPVVRNGSHVADGLHLDSRGLEGPNGGLPARSRSFHPYFEALAAESSRRLGRLGCRLLGRARRFLARAL